ncbi:TPA: hypothetical protein DIU27_02350 [Candidatus Collierbacteria bacterium]|nr:MAG: hypothetical protein UW56_C0009G0039 [Candidatus Collierbacteria bacterium GW2011_GWD1_44_27]KKT89744.1 MAG: hypothetical protein UW88_C0001G0124 [Candidatus Collierbacteria bacterium GW2011_GWD2_45_10]HCQ31202.1 hypothetical protein [Candidatus Collierbacteria bacterium]
MRPATGVVSEELKYLSNQLRNALEGGWRADKDSLQIGTELEIMFFSPDSDPGLILKQYERMEKRDWDLDWETFIRRTRNPNYTTDHRRKVLRVANFAKALQKKYPNEFYPCTRDSKLMIEFRTAPQNLEAHYDNVCWLADSIRKVAQKENLLPVIKSQHIHLSCKTHNLKLGEKRAYKYIDSERFKNDFINESFTRILPFVMLPEEYDGDDDHIVVQRNHAGELNHPEFRLLSSEYANDHILNLALCLRSLYASLMNETYATDVVPEPTYFKALQRMQHDEELINFFGESTLSKLCKIVKQYPAVSRREKTISEVK